jgi:diaminohydroxyphosphoribosylaminopyrimidine deaminase / 5-amino-6-(5-phosphoribosylamino)uracil reductase
MSEKDSQYMRKCLELAERGRGAVEPNPMVGAIIVSGGRIVGRGWHQRYGGAHAEVEALRSAGDRARGATMYVSLEPCNHFGKTPPCTEAILDAGVAKVVIGMPDPNPAVAGGGAARLRSAGIMVSENVEQQRCEALNEVWLANTLHQRPFVLLKIAQTLDGFIAAAKGNSHWITSEESRIEVHRLRSLYEAVLVGAGTVRKDNPSLTVRHVQGRDPLRVVLTRSWGFPRSTALFTDGSPERTLVVTSVKAAKHHADEVAKFRARGVTVLEVSTDPMEYASLSATLKALYVDVGVRSLLVEGGAEVFSTFVHAGLADRIDVFTAPIVLGQGIGAFSALRPLHLSGAHRYNVEHVQILGGDTYTVLRSRKE